MSDKKTVKVKLVKSIAGTKESHRATVRGLGLRKLNSERDGSKTTFTTVRHRWGTVLSVGKVAEREGIQVGQEVLYNPFDADPGPGTSVIVDAAGIFIYRV